MGADVVQGLVLLLAGAAALLLRVLLLAVEEPRVGPPARVVERRVEPRRDGGERGHDVAEPLDAPDEVRLGGVGVAARGLEVAVLDAVGLARGVGHVRLEAPQPAEEREAPRVVAGRRPLRVGEALVGVERVRALGADRLELAPRVADEVVVLRERAVQGLAHEQDDGHVPPHLAVVAAHDDLAVARRPRRRAAVGPREHLLRVLAAGLVGRHDGELRAVRRVALEEAVGGGLARQVRAGAARGLGRKRVRNSRLQRLLSRSFSTRFG